MKRPILASSIPILNYFRNINTPSTECRTDAWAWTMFEDDGKTDGEKTKLRRRLANKKTASQTAQGNSPTTTTNQPSRDNSHLNQKPTILITHTVQHYKVSSSSWYRGEKLELQSQIAMQ